MSSLSTVAEAGVLELQFRESAEARPRRFGVLVDRCDREPAEHVRGGVADEQDAPGARSQERHMAGRVTGRVDAPKPSRSGKHLPVLDLDVDRRGIGSARALGEREHDAPGRPARDAPRALGTVKDDARLGAVRVDGRAGRPDHLGQAARVIGVTVGHRDVVYLERGGVGSRGRRQAAEIRGRTAVDQRRLVSRDQVRVVVQPGEPESSHPGDRLGRAHDAVKDVTQSEVQLSVLTPSPADRARC